MQEPGFPGRRPRRHEGKGQCDFGAEPTDENTDPSDGLDRGRRKWARARGGRAAGLTPIPGPRTMDPSELSAVSRRPTDSGAAREAAAPWDVQLRPRKALNRCARCLHHGATDQIKDAKHRCLFQTCKCRKCTRYS